LEDFRIGNGDALVIVDLQKDFCAGGFLEIPQADAIVPVINRLAGNFPKVVIAQDWHPVNHISFASSHSGHTPGDIVDTAYGRQPLFLDHCVQGTPGAELHPDLVTNYAHLIIRKGFHKDVDSFSAFCENDGQTRSGLAEYLRANGISRIFFAGLALLGCVRRSAEDARKEGFDAVILNDAARSRSRPQTDGDAERSLQQHGVVRTTSDHLVFQ
jgi:nicotinamidase/pyrazinamidase